MINNKGNRVCDAEMGSVKRGWHGCGKPAICSCVSKYNQILDFCERHKKRATQEGRKPC
jgi:hypothetical protein